VGGGDQEIAPHGEIPTGRTRRSVTKQPNRKTLSWETTSTLRRLTIELFVFLWMGKQLFQVLHAFWWRDFRKDEFQNVFWVFLCLKHNPNRVQ